MTKRQVRSFLRVASTLAAMLVLAASSFALVSEQVIYAFPKSGDQGYFPETQLVYRSGRLFGTTNNGGGAQCNCGVVFSLTRKTGGGWNYQVLHAFQGGTDGYQPLGNIVFDAAGNLYGTTFEGGLNFAGTVYELSPANGTWTYKIIYSFGGNGDGPYAAGLAIDAAGNLYGPTLAGGVSNNGMVYQLTPGTGGSWSESVLYSFSGPNDGSNPNANVVLDAAGNLYGTTSLGGANNLGTVFELSPGLGGIWTETTLLSPSSNIGNPVSVMLDSAGHVFGTSIPSPTGTNLGTVFELIRNSDGAWSDSILHTFVNVKGGQWPKGALILDANGNLCGTTQFGGSAGAGTVYKLKPGSGGTWTFGLVYSFTGGTTDGTSPIVGVTRVNNGLFGTTASGGTDGSSGVIFEVKF
jgi:uncharacterized repeat protein (TIGR03803 family)